MMLKYFVTQGTKILLLFGWFSKFGKNKERQQGWVHCGEVSKMGKERIFLTVRWPI